MLRPKVLFVFLVPHLFTALLLSSPPQCPCWCSFVVWACTRNTDAKSLVSQDPLLIYVFQDTVEDQPGTACGFALVFGLTFLAFGSHEVRAAQQIVFGMSAPLNTTVTPAANLGLLMYSGLSLAFAEANSKFGGINGYQLTLLPLDDSYLPANTVANVESDQHCQRVRYCRRYWGRSVRRSAAAQELIFIIIIFHNYCFLCAWFSYFFPFCPCPSLLPIN